MGQGSGRALDGVEELSRMGELRMSELTRVSKESSDERVPCFPNAASGSRERRGEVNKNHERLFASQAQHPYPGLYLLQGALVALLLQLLGERKLGPGVPAELLQPVALVGRRLSLQIQTINPNLTSIV